MNLCKIYGIEESQDWINLLKQAYSLLGLRYHTLLAGVQEVRAWTYKEWN